jgi:hypothetical protein
MSRLEEGQMPSESKPAWFVRETPCYPSRWKVDTNVFRTDNSFVHYYPTQAAAQAEANRRNVQDRSAWWNDADSTS